VEDGTASTDKDIRGSSSHDGSLPNNWLENALESKSETAAKNDDAKVPLEFWDMSLAKKLHKAELSIEESRALNVLRDWSVNCIWKRSLTKCFCKWMRCNKCHFDSLSGFFDSRTSSVRSSHSPCNSCKDFARTPEVHQWVNGNGHLEYGWKTNRKRDYKKMV
jgi:hypothetical protein